MMQAFLSLVADLMTVASSPRDGITGLRSIEAVYPGDATFDIVTERSFA
jgi:hypothetical protein